MIASRYGWTMDYILWGISWANIRLMLADAIRSDYKTGKASGGEKQEMPDVLDLSDPHALDVLRHMAM